MATPKTTRGGTIAQARRSKIRAEFWPDALPWRGPSEVGFFCGPRSLPFVLRALREKAVSGNLDPGPVYLELLANHMGEGVLELRHEEDHAFAAGYSNSRSWRDRMRVLEEAGFIKTKKSGNRPYGTVLLVHPTVVMNRLHEQGKLTENLWATYREFQIRTKEPSVGELGNWTDAG